MNGGREWGSRQPHQERRKTELGKAVNVRKRCFTTELVTIQHPQKEEEP